MVCIVTLAACDKLIGDTTVPLPATGIEMVVSYRVKAMDSPRFETVISNRYGSLHHRLWENWGPAVRGNVYMTPDNRIVVIGGGGRAFMFETTEGEKPRFIPKSEHPEEDGASWVYIGAFIAQDGGKMRFYSSTEMAERIALYGAGSSPYRTVLQDTHGG